jgi:hypothetical protein
MSLVALALAAKAIDALCSFDHELPDQWGGFTLYRAGSTGRLRAYGRPRVGVFVSDSEPSGS